ncbi:hypothetical protein O6R08_04260 [Cutibacterium equinum]|uniref:6-pyruvoyl tetrahydrobiopterin synthase n=1 Tax=Cutibacterium equinum TaxID=3016342 RepID=A0ABY7R280_9ACTN|nr:hypothetical protein [Cutibacterium equinum]WCC80702.1 hypothetical protein O6R08_04260 [Cutibacterium equinum]
MAGISYNAQKNPYLGPAGSATMHCDAQASDASPMRGPGVPGPGQRWVTKEIKMGGACPTILVGEDNIVQVLCTKVVSSDGIALQPNVATLSADGTPIDDLNLPKGALLGGVYAYIDNANRMVLVDGTSTLIRVAHDAGGGNLHIDSRFDLSSVLRGDQIVGLTPDWQGRIWLASKNALTIVVDFERGMIRATKLQQFATTEVVDNSISSSPDGVNIITSHGIYQLHADEMGRPQISWSHSYDRGNHRKPGQLAWGSGASPTFFGPNGSDYVMLSDNADDQESVIVYRVADGKLIGSAKLFQPGKSGTENSMIGIGNTIIGASTYGYPYPKYPDGAGTSVPKSAPFAPGMERWDITEKGLVNVWKRDDVYSSAVPRYCAPDNIIYTCERGRGFLGIDPIFALAIDMETGETLHRVEQPGKAMIGSSDTLEMVGVIKDGVWWQGTISRILRISMGA